MNSFTPIPSQCLSRYAGGSSRCIWAYVCASLQLSGVVFALIGPCLLSHRASVGMLVGPFVYMHACICVQCTNVVRRSNFYMNSFTLILSQFLSRYAGVSCWYVRAYVCVSLQLSWVIFALIDPCLFPRRASVGMLMGHCKHSFMYLCAVLSQ